MSLRSEKVDATFYAQVEPQWGYQTTYDRKNGVPPRLLGAKVVATTQQRPGRPRSGVVLVKLTLRLPAGAFLPLQPEAVVEIPDSLTETVLEVTATDPTDAAEV